MQPHPPVDWHTVDLTSNRSVALVDSCRRMRWLLAAFLLALAIIGSRAVWLEVTSGPQARRLAAQGKTRDVRLPAARGRLLASDGTVLAVDQPMVTLEVHYRYLQQPPDEAWFRQQVRRRLSAAERADPAQVAREARAFRVELAELHRSLPRMAGVSAEAWAQRRQRIQIRVERIAQSVNARHRERNRPPANPAPASESTWAWLRRQIREALVDSPTALPMPRIIVREQLDYHRMAEDIRPSVAEQLADRTEVFPGVRCTVRTGRRYPQGAVAGHLVGYLGVVGADELALRQVEPEGAPLYEAEDLTGRAGLERLYEDRLRGTKSVVRERLDRHGRRLGAEVLVPATSGADVQLTLDLKLQASAEQLLDRAIHLGRLRGEQHGLTSGGAVVVMDIDNGALLACASAPRFDPNTMVRGDAQQVSKLLNARDGVLLCRPIQMAIPPGSVMKVATALALLETGTVAADEPFRCQGYLHRPTSQRCALYRQFGIGHDRVALVDALAKSCNVYFFHYAEPLGREALLGWMQRVGFGQPTGIDLPGELSGQIPGLRLPDDQTALTDTQAAAIGQSTLLVTPLQVARLMAAVANGGRLPRPHLLADGDRQSRATGDPIPGLSADSLAVVRQGMRQAVTSVGGTVHRQLGALQAPVAVKTGTAQAAAGRREHAWIAGFAPVDRPRYALVVVLEHGGDAAQTAGAATRDLVRRMAALGYF